MKIILIFAFILSLVSCQKKETNQPENENSFVISNAWMRPGLKNRNSAAFFNITNNTNRPDTLFAASSEIAKIVEIHESYKRENDMMGMRHIEYVVVQPNSILKFTPGGYHVMLIGLNNNIRQGDSTKIALNFKLNGKMNITSNVRLTN